jgi:hypothetical protein
MLEDKNLEEMTVEELEKLKRYIDRLDYTGSENERTSIGFDNFFDLQQKALRKIDREIRKVKKREEKEIELKAVLKLWGELTNKLTELGYEWDIKWTGYLVVYKDGEKVIDFIGNCAEQNKVIKQYLESVGHD